MVFKAEIEHRLIDCLVCGTRDKNTTVIRKYHVHVYSLGEGESEQNSVNWQRATLVCRKWACTRVGGGSTFPTHPS